jgi:hypothetical protein
MSEIVGYNSLSAIFGRVIGFFVYTEKEAPIKKISINIFSHVANALLYACSCVLSHTSYRFHQSRNFFSKGNDCSKPILAQYLFT